MERNTGWKMIVYLAKRDVPQWGDDPAHSAKTERNRVELPRFASTVKSATSDTQAIISDLQAKRISKTQAMAKFRDVLRTHETEAFVAGRRARGDVRDHLTEAEEKMLTGRFSRNMRYFSNFCDDVISGEGRMPYHQRAEAYAKSLWSIYTRGETSDWQDPNAKNLRYHWITDADVEHCSDCLERGAHSVHNDGYSWDELSEIGWPGEKTKCMYNCHCHIRVLKPKSQAQKPLERPEYETPAYTPEAGLQRLEKLLGGPTMPNLLPAAGVPFVAVNPDVIRSSLASVPSAIEREELMRHLPLLPETLLEPESVLRTPDTRIYAKGRVGVAIERQVDGLWKLVLIMLSMSDNKKEATRDNS